MNIDYGEFSDAQLAEFHKAIRVALVDDDERAALNLIRKFGVREHPDFREQRDIVEALLKDRGVPFEPIPF